MIAIMIAIIVVISSVCDLLLAFLKEIYLFILEGERAHT